MTGSVPGPAGSGRVPADGYPRHEFLGGILKLSTHDSFFSLLSNLEINCATPPIIFQLILFVLLLARGGKKSGNRGNTRHTSGHTQKHAYGCQSFASGSCVRVFCGIEINFSRSFSGLFGLVHSERLSKSRLQVRTHHQKESSRG